MLEDEDEVVAVIGADTTPGTIPPSVRRVYGGFGCIGCGRVCGYVDNDGRCQTCGPIPVEKPELLSPREQTLAALQREHDRVELRRRARLYLQRGGRRRDRL